MEKKSALGLKERIIQAQNSNESSLVNLILDFRPLINKFARLLQCEDAFYDLQCDFIELILSIVIKDRFANDYALVAYIKKSMHCFYVKRSKKVQADNSFIVLCNEGNELDILAIDNDYTYTDDMIVTEFEFFIKYLTHSELLTLWRIYYVGLSVAEIALIENISRQTVNMTKNRALHKLKRIYYGTLNTAM